MKIRILNLYAGIGGNRELWPNEKIEVTAVENKKEIATKYKELFPDDKIIVTDAHEFLLKHLDEYDFIWSSPPCPTHSRTNTFLMTKGYRRYPDMNLYQEVIFLSRWHRGKYCVENVIPYYTPLIPGQKCGRHLFWANFFISDLPNIPKDFTQFSEKRRSKRITGNKRVEERNKVNPKIGLHIFNCAFKSRQTVLK